MTIEWKYIEGYENEYRINNLSEVQSIKLGKWKTIVPYKNKSNGYLTIKLTNGIKSKHHTIHRLLAILFVDNPENKGFVNHKDGNKLNNKLRNLEWCTKSENGLHAYAMGLNKGGLSEQRYFYGKTGSKNPNSRPLMVIFKKEIKTISFISIKEAMNYFDVSESYFREIVSGRKKSNLYNFQFY
jgi:hypothetical protein